MSETAETEAAEEESKEPAVEKPREEVKTAEAKPRKKKSKGVYVHYKVEEGKLKRMLPFCERCGPGYFMADHGDRYTCGHCGFTRYKPAETSK
jgi:small subunit ribosomal protein S27Ae